MSTQALRAHLQTFFSAGVESADPAQLIRRTVRAEHTHLSVHSGSHTSTFPIQGRVFLIGAGKGAGRMAQALLQIFLPVLGERLAGGVVIVPQIVPQDAQLELEPLSTVHGEHPLPGQGSLRGGKDLMALLANRQPSDLICFCLTGGASSLLVQPVQGVSLEDKLAVNRLLLASGADIQAINTVRKHLSQIKGGNLAHFASPATVLSFILSDVIGDDLSTIGSGPTVADPTTFQDAWDILENYDLLTAIPNSVKSYLTQGLSGLAEETPKPGEAVFSNVHNFLIGSNSLALEAAACAAHQHGFTPEILPEPLDGDTTQAARAFARQIQTRLQEDPNDKRRVCLLAGGETTVQVRGKGKGGRNQEFALVVAQELHKESGWTLLSAGTDGIDGPTDAAGAFVDGESLRRAHEKGIDPQAALQDNDSYTLFATLGDLFQPGPTGTNVMDIKIVLIGPLEGV